ncbi:BglG family transcription antiterminator [Propionispora hippei]|uniref:Mannitol operon transcriptional antiterminator n=1 Tax=Propionispora hippei DSM 15287 TaxID=1123003 RepID=A0A1M6L299_9FIRM|nr:BglG family transcription antiterminator [Propionispora hippei]SHJ65293.1 mannitol operon transcriptional antiterminator [Propionispora hippei DSM 15287]
MGVSSRQRMILNILLTEEQEITIKDIADRIEVSTRTVHRELTELEPLLEQQGLQLVKRSGIGVAIEGEARQKEELRLSLYNQTTVEYAPDERKLLILCQLLEATEPVKLVSLAFDLKVTTATISYDLDEMVDWLRRYDLTLLRKRGYGVELCGSESAKRKAMSELITEHLDEFELLGILKENIHGKSTRHINTVSERLLGLIEKEKLIMIENSLRTLEEELPYPLADSSFIGLVIHLALAIERIEKGEQITFDEEHLKELELTSEFRIAETIIQRLRSIFQMDIPDSEIGYITMHLRGAKLRSSYDDWFEFKNLELVTKVNRMIRYCEEQLDVSFQADPNLVQGLLTHIEPALFRIQKNMKIRNPLLTEIKARYSDLFQVLKQAVAEVFDELTVPEEEIGYLVMHIGASLERMGQFNQKFRALVVCSSGIGSSKILASRIEKELPYIGLAKNISLFDINKIPETEYDLIISTVPLSLQRDDYVLVTPLLTKEDVHNINVFLKGIRKGPWQPDASNVLNTEEVLSDLRGWQAYIGHTLSIIENFRFDTVLNQNMHIEEVLEAICRKLEQLQVIRDKEEVIEKLLERQRLGGLGIPNMRLALFHAKTEAVLRPAARLYLLDNPLLIKGMDKKYLDVDRILLLLAPARISKEGLEVLSEVSSLLIEDELAPILESGNQQRIIAFFTTHLYKYVLAKIKKER